MGPPEHPHLRAWRDEDLGPYVALHTDPDVGYWLGGAWSETGARESFERVRRLRNDGLGLWPIVDGGDELVGVCGLGQVRAELPVHPAVEAMWRLLPLARGQGLVTSAMQPILARGFEAAGCKRIVAFTARTNVRSQAVMRRLRFEADPQAAFDHPALPNGHPLKPHVVYILHKDRGAPC